MTTDNENTLAVNGKISEFINYVLTNLPEIDSVLRKKGLDEALQSRLLQCKSKLDLATELTHIAIVNQSLKEIGFKSDAKK